MGEVNISKRGAKRIRSGHLWVYKSDLRELRDADGGTIVSVLDEARNFVGQAFYSDASEIALRFLTTHREAINLINPDRFAIAIKRDHDAKADGRFGGGHDDDENCEYLPGHHVAASGVLQVTREGDEVQVRRVQNQLDRHEDDEQIAARQHARDANDEKDRSDHQELREIWMLDALERGRSATCFLKHQR